MTLHEIKKCQFQQLSGLSNPAFRKIWEIVTQHIQNEPENSIGVAGPLRDKEAFQSWVIGYFDDGIGQQFWGQGAQGKWRMADDRDDIIGYFRALVMNRAKNERQRRRKGRKPKVASLEQARGVGHGGGDLDEGMRGLLPGGSPFSQNKLRGTSTQPSSPGNELSTVTTRRSNFLLFPSDSKEVNRAFKTRLGPENIIIHVFAPLTISFRCFFGCFCGAWGIEQSELMSSDNTEVEVSIAKLGEYRVVLGRDREKGWCHIMELAGSIPESEITVIF